MRDSDSDILIELKKLSSQLKNVGKQQNQLKDEMGMIFSDIACFENLMLKMMDALLQKKEGLEKYDH